MAYRSSSTNSGASATPSVGVPAGVQAGDIVIVTINIDATGAAVDPADLPASFVELAETDITFDGQTAWVGYKRLTGADAGSYTFGNVNATADWVCQAYAFSGRHATNPPVVSTTAVLNTGGGGTSVSVTANGVTAVAGDDLLWICSPDVNATGAGNGTTPPATFTEAQDAENLWANSSGAYKDNVSAGATGTVSGTFNYTSNAGYAAWLIRVPVGSVAADATVTSPAAVGSGDVATPAVTADSEVITGPLAGSGDVPSPVVTADSTVTSPAAGGTGDVPDPTASGSSDVTVTSPAGTGAGDVPAPTVTADSTVTSPPAGGTGDVPAPAVQIGAQVDAPAASGTGDVPTPDTPISVTVQLPVMGDGTNVSGTGDIPTPTVTGTGSSTVQPPALDGTGDVPAPAVTGTHSATVTAPPLRGSGDVPAPSVSDGAQPVQMVPLEQARTAVLLTVGATSAAFESPARAADIQAVITSASFQQATASASIEQPVPELVF